MSIHNKKRKIIYEMKMICLKLYLVFEIKYIFYQAKCFVSLFQMHFLEEVVINHTSLLDNI